MLPCRIKPVFCLLGLFLLAPSLCLGQRYNFKAYTIDDGLAQSQPVDILQSSSGYLWVGTRGGGVSRFDGQSFQNYTKYDGLLSGDILSLAEDHQGNIWIGTALGVSRYDGKDFHAVSIGVENSGVTAIVPDAEGNIWIGTDIDGLVFLDKNLSPIRYTQGDGMPEEGVNTLFLDNKGTLWIGTEEGLCRRDTNAFVCFTTADGLPHNSVQSVAQDSKGAFWIGTREGIVTYDGERFQPTKFEVLRDLVIFSIELDRQGALWFGTDEGLFWTMGSLIKQYNKPNGLVNDDVWVVREDREGNLWIGTDSGSLFRYAFSPFVLYNTDHGLPDVTSWTILEDQNQDIWFGTHEGGVSRFDGTSFTNYSTEEGLADNRVYGSLMDREGILWFGTRGGISRYDGQRFSSFAPEELDDTVWALHEDQKGTFWFGTSGSGLYKYEDGGFTQYTMEDGLPTNDIYVIHEDSQGNLWLGSFNGLVRFDGTTFSDLANANNLGSNEYISILSDSDGDLWMGTYGGGLLYFDATAMDDMASFRTITVADGLSDDYVLATTLDDDENLWVCTNNGLNKLNLKAYKATGKTDFTRFGAAEGFTGQECNSGAALRDSRGQLWFGTVKGVMQYRPGHETSHTHEPLTHITNIRLFFEEQDWSTYSDGFEPETMLPANLKLRHNQNYLTFDFIGINLAAPEKVSYQYQLEGLNPAWTPATKETRATYANLLPGEYTFNVRAVSHTGTWNAQPTSYSFVITPPFWRTAWFFLTCIAGILLGGFAFIRRRENKLRQRQERLEKTVEDRTLALRREKEKVDKINVKLAQLSLVAQETDNAVIITDAEGRIEWVNEGFTRMSGYTLEAITKARGEFLQDASYFPAIQEAIDKAVRDRESTIYESQVESLDGGRLWLSSTLTPVTDEHGVVQKLVVIDADITDHKALEAELIAAREVALEAARVKSEFLANMSHEIRTPMNGVIGMTSLLLDTNLDSEQQEFVQVIRTSGDALLGIINDILDFSKIEAGKIELEEQVFDVHEVIEEALDLVARRATEKNLELTYFIKDGVPPAVRGDVTRVRQVLTNLLSNAVKFTESGEITISVEVRGFKKGRHHLHFAVRDTGIGIPPDRMNLLFESFSQVDASTTRRFGGTGLGLAISKRLVEMMGGEMSVESEVNIGSTFHFSIHIPEAVSPNRQRILMRQATELRNKRVLIVDDNATNRRMLSIQLTRWGMTVREATSGPEALDILDQGMSFDLAILDMQMPEIDGLMVARSIASNEKTAELPLIMLSSMGHRTNLDGTHLTAWLTKPAKKHQLFDTLLDALSPRVVETVQPRTPFYEDTPLAKTVPLRILLAEDNVVNQKVLTQFLSRLGYRADVVANGIEVLDALKRSHYDVVLMDVQMPEMDGLEATRRIVSSYGAKERPRIIAITANATLSDQQRCLDAGMDDYLSKPVRIDDLATVLQRSNIAFDGETSTSGHDAGTSSEKEKHPIISLRALKKNVGDDPGFIGEVLQTYLSDAPRLISTMKKAYADEDAVGLERAAHTLKSSSKMFGADTLSRVCGALEKRANMKKLEEAAALIPQLETAYETVREAISSYLQQENSSQNRGSAHSRPSFSRLGDSAT